jgi:hypothetical protein
MDLRRIDLAKRTGQKVNINENELQGSIREKRSN